MKRKKWAMPVWMEPYRASLTYGDRAEELMNTPVENATVFNNAPLALICVAMKTGIGLLERLRAKGLLDDDAANRRTG